MYIVYNMYVYVIAHMQKSIHLKTAQVGQFLYWKTIQGHSKPLGLMGRVRFYSFRICCFLKSQNQINKAWNIMGPSFGLFCLSGVRSIFIFELLTVSLQTALAPLGFEWPLPTKSFESLRWASLVIQIKGLIHTWTGFPIGTITHIHISTYFHQACNNWFKITPQYW